MVVRLSAADLDGRGMVDVMDLLLQIQTWG
jgi:hypothetical protein